MKIIIFCAIIGGMLSFFKDKEVIREPLIDNKDE